MKGFLFDSNLPSRIQFTPTLPIIHAHSLSNRPTDTDLWEHARLHDLAIVSKDTDFSNRIMGQSPPPRVVHLRFGNLRRREYQALLARFWPRIEYLIPRHKLVNVYHDRIEAVG
jgi:predicted nuclease of predicted toxin-antitoxin system